MFTLFQPKPEPPKPKPSAEEVINRLDKELDRRMEWLLTKKWISAERKESLKNTCDDLFFRYSEAYLEESINVATQDPAPGERRSDPNG